MDMEWRAGSRPGWMLEKVRGSANGWMNGLVGKIDTLLARQKGGLTVGSVHSCTDNVVIYRPIRRK